MALLVQLECLDHETEGEDGEAVVRVKYDARSFKIIEVQVGRD